ncbi:MAG: glycerophosphoryl diester phosphodiesterase membrane domain-containing protein [Mycobacteriales bacterium]
MSYTPDQPPPGWTPPSDAPPAWQPPAGGHPAGYGQEYGPGYGQGYGQVPAFSPPPVPQWQSAPKPGITPLRPLGVGEILDGSFAALRHYPLAILSVCALAATFSGVTSFLLVIATRDSPVGSDVPLLVNWFNGFVGMVTWGVINAALAVIIGDAVLGRPVVRGAAWAQIRPRLGAIAGAAVVTSILLVVGFLVFVIPGIYLSVALAFTTPAIVLEGRGIIAAMKRSRALVSGAWWRTLGVLLLAGMICSFLYFVISVTFVAIAGADNLYALASSDVDFSVAQIAIVTLGGIIAWTLVGAIMGGVSVLLYMDRRMRREGLDVALAQAAARSQYHPGP